MTSNRPRVVHHLKLQTEFKKSFPPCFLPSPSTPYCIMNLYYLWLLLLVVLSVYSEGPLHVTSPDSVAVIDSSAQLGILASGLPQNEVYDLGMKIPAPLWVLDLGLNNPAPLWVLRIALPQNEVLKLVPLYKSGKLLKRPKIGSLLNLGLENFKNMTSTLIHSAEKLGWTIRITLKCFQHILRMYAWSLCENQASVSLRCRLIGLFLKQSFLTKHDFAVYVYKLRHSCQIMGFWHLGIFSTCKNNCDIIIPEHLFGSSSRFHFHGGGKVLAYILIR